MTFSTAQTCQAQGIGRAKRKSYQWKRLARERIRKRDGLLCLKCGCEDRLVAVNWGSGTTHDNLPFTWVYFRSFLELDHIVPLHIGGGNDDDNLQLLCPSCHLEKTRKERSSFMRGKRHAAKDYYDAQF